MFTAAAFRCSNLCLWFFLGGKGQIDANSHLKIKNSDEKHTFAGAESHQKLCSPMFGEIYIYVNLCGIINGIEEIAGGFTSKVDLCSLLKIMFNLSMLQKASKRRSPNPFNYWLK